MEVEKSSAKRTFKMGITIETDGSCGGGGGLNERHYVFVAQVRNEERRLLV